MRLPAARDLEEPFRIRTGALVQKALGGRLQGKITGRKHIRPAKAHQQIDVRSPRTNAFDRDKLLMRFPVIHAGQALEVERALRHSFSRGAKIALLGA